MFISMNKNIFTKDFYKKVYDEAWKACENDYVNEDGEKYDVNNVLIHVDNYEIELTAYVECEWEDGSFDHAFGTWHDPYAGYVFGDIYDISDVTVWDENGDEVEGFSTDDYKAQFIESSHGNIRKGDKVKVVIRYGEQYGICEVLNYNTRTCKFSIKSENGQVYQMSPSYIKKVA